MGKPKRVQGEAELKLLQYLAKHGPSHMYPFHESKSKRYIAARSTVHRAKKNLMKPSELALIYLKERQEREGKDRLVFGLTFRGLHYALKKGLVDFNKVKKIVQEHEIKIPQITEADLEDYLQVISSHSSLRQKKNHTSY